VCVCVCVCVCVNVCECDLEATTVPYRGCQALEGGKKQNKIRRRLCKHAS